MRNARLVMLAVVMLAVPFLFAPAAFAHHPTISATVACTGEVSFTSTAWPGNPNDPNTPEDENALSRTNPTVVISYSGDGGPFVTLETTYSYAPSAFSFTDSFTLPAPLPSNVVVQATATGTWGTPQAGGQSAQTAALTVPECPAEPSAVISEIDCALEGVDVVLTNSGGGSVVFAVTRAGVAQPDVPVGPDESVTVNYPVAEDEIVAFTISAPGMTTVQRSVERNCADARAVISDLQCAEGGVAIMFANDGDGPVTFTVTRNGVPQADVPVGPNDNVTVNYAVAEDESVTFVVSSQGIEPVIRSLTRNCVDTAAAISGIDCADGGVAIEFSNVGAGPVVFLVSRDGVAQPDVTVGSGETTTRSYAVDEGESASFSVSAPGMETVTRSLTRNCTEPSASVPAVNCAQGGASIVYTNAGTGSVTFSVTRNSVAQPDVLVGPAGSTSRLYIMAEDETATFVVTAPGTSLTRSVTYDCVANEVAGGGQTRPPATAPAPPVVEAAPEPGLRPAPAPVAEGEILSETGSDISRHAVIAVLLVSGGLFLLGSAHPFTGLLVGTATLVATRRRRLARDARSIEVDPRWQLPGE